MKLDLYIITTRSGKATIFSPPEAIGAIEEHSTDRIRQFIDWCARRQNRVMAWIGRGVRSLHDYYVKLEDKIDPVERVLKAMASTNEFAVYTQIPKEFAPVLKKQRWKHVFWFSIDFLITGVVIMLTPVLMPIPGPNFFFYYPFLRLLSHYRAILGTLSGLRSRHVEFKDLPERSRLEDNLSGFARFLERMD